MMASTLSLALLLTLVQQITCQVVITSSASRDSGFNPPQRPLLSSFQPSTTSSLPGSTEEPTEEPTQSLGITGVARQTTGKWVEEENQHGEKEETSGRRHLEHAYSMGSNVGGHERNDMDGLSAFFQRQIEEGNRVTLGDLTDPPSEATSLHHPAGPQQNGAASSVLTPKSFSSGIDQAQPGTAGSPSPAATKTVVEPKNEVGEEGWQIAGSGDWPPSPVSEVESSSASHSERSDKLANVQPQAQTTTGFTTITNAPTSSTVTQVSQLRPTSIPSNLNPHTGSHDLQTTPAVSTSTRKPIVSRVGLEKGKFMTQNSTSPILTKHKSTTVMSASNQSAKTEPTAHTTPTPPPKAGGGFALKTGQAFEKNASVLLGHPPLFPSSPASSPSPADPCASGRGPCWSPAPPNGTLLLWGDLRRTLAFAWELHVYGTAVLFLLLAVGALVGLLLSPSLHCPHRGCLALANALLLLAGTLRSTLFFLDPYGACQLLSRPGVAALYNLPLPPLQWAQASLGLLMLRVGSLTRLLPPGLQRPPLVAVLGMLHCTVLLAADLLSAALSPAVPTVLQALSLSWGLLLCLGFLLYAFPQTQRPPEDATGRVELWSTRVLGRVLAVCTLLGALCCGLHVYATLWLYGWLGPWRSFSWTWWLVHFWARLLELGWFAFMLIVASWVFWRPGGREPGSAEGAPGADPPSSSCSSSSAQRHPCWAKIVWSLRGRPCRKSEGNGMGELPNNWAGQERPGADISKSLIRNRDQAPGPRGVKDSNRGRNQQGAATGGSSGSLLRLHPLGRAPQRSLSSSLDREKEWVLQKESTLSLTDFDLRPPSPIDLTRSIDEALHREHLLHGGTFFGTSSPSPLMFPGRGNQPSTSWLRRSSDPQINLSSQNCGLEEEQKGGSAEPEGGNTAGEQTTAPPSPTQPSSIPGRDKDGVPRVPTSISCPVSFRPYRVVVQRRGAVGDDTKPFVTPDSEADGAPVGVSHGASRGLLEVSRQDDSASMSSEIIDL